MTHPVTNGRAIKLNGPTFGVQVKRGGRKVLVVCQGIEKTKDDALWFLLPEDIKVLDDDGNVVRPSGKFYITVETIDPYHLLADK